MNKTNISQRENKLLKLHILNTILSLLNTNEDYVASISNLASTCSLPLSYTRNVVLALLSNPLLGKYMEATELPDLEPEELANRIQQGDFDSIRWKLDVSYYVGEDTELLSLTRIEHRSFQKIMRKDRSSFEIKSIVPELSPEIEKRMEEIRLLMEQNKEIRFQYRFNSNTIATVECKPVSLTTNTTDNLIYLHAEDGRCFRLDRIFQRCQELKETPKKSSEPVNELPDDNRIQYLWGPSCPNSETPEYVKLKIAKYARDGRFMNITNKIKNDLRFREETCKISEDEAFMYIEDTVLGMANFKRWLRGYGSSIEVLEPQHVRDEILQSARITLEQYARINEWKDL